MKKDYQTKKGRLNKKSTVTKLEKIILTLIVLWTIYFVFQAVRYIVDVHKDVPVGKITQVIEYTDLKPLPETNWNFTPINQR